MKKKYLFLLFVVFFSSLAGQIYTNLNIEISSRYNYHRLLPAGKNPVCIVNANTYLSQSGIGLSSWYVQSLGNFGAYLELGISAYYYHELRENMYLSGGISANIFPYENSAPLTGLSVDLNFSDMRRQIPYAIETHWDPLIGSWYTKVSAAYTWDSFLPFQFQLSTAFDLLPYMQFGISVPAGISDISLQTGTYLSLKNWHIQPKLTYIIPLNVPSGPQMLLSAALNVGYTF